MKKYAVSVVGLAPDPLAFTCTAASEAEAIATIRVRIEWRLQNLMFVAREAGS